MSEIDSLLTQLGTLTQQASEGKLEVPPELMEEAEEVTASVADDTIRVSMKAGKATKVYLHPKAMRLDNVTLGEKLVEAINEVIGLNLAAVMNAEAPDGETLTSLNKQLQQIQTESVAAMERYNQGMLDMLRKAKDL